MMLLSLYAVTIVIMFVVATRPVARAVAAQTRPVVRAVAVRAGPFARAVAVRAGPVVRAVGGWARRKSARAADRSMPAPAVRPSSLEGMIVALLIAGEITNCEYRRAVEELAAQDDAYYPLSVPTDPGGG